MVLKLRSYILDLVHLKLSLDIFFLLSCLMESLLQQLSGKKNTQQKAANLMFCLILTVEWVQFKVVKCNITFFVDGSLIRLVWGS